MQKQLDKISIKEQYALELEKWQTNIDIAKLQMYFGGVNAKQKLGHLILKMDKELRSIKKQLKMLETTSDESIHEIVENIEASLVLLQVVFDSTKQQSI